MSTARKAIIVTIITVILAIISVPLSASANGAAATTASSKPSTSAVAAKQAVMGLITAFTSDKTGKFVTVKGHGIAPNPQSEVILALTSTTKIVDTKGQTITISKIRSGQKTVKAYYTADKSTAGSARGTALTLIAQDQTSSAIEGTVIRQTPNGFIVRGNNIYTGAAGTFTFVYLVTNSIYDQKGIRMESFGIERGMYVRAFYDPTNNSNGETKLATGYITVDTTKQVTIESGTSGIVTNMKEGIIAVAGKPIGEGTAALFLGVNEDTVIVSETGVPLTIDDVEIQGYVEAYYDMFVEGPINTIGVASKLIVKNKTAVEVIGFTSQYDASNGQVYLDVNSDSDTENDLVLNITDSTIILSLRNGQLTNLDEDLAVSAYYFPAADGAANADVIFVWYPHDSKNTDPSTLPVPGSLE